LLEKQHMKITILGTGTSQGVPVIGCSCDVCTSANPKDSRLRTSVYIETPEVALLVDCGPDFRQQMLQNNIVRLDAVVLTHEHADHVMGMDDLRSFIFRNNCPMPIYAERRVLNIVKKQFWYAFLENPYPGAPQFNLINLVPGNLIIKNLEIQVLRAMHGKLPILGIRVGNFAYLTDVNFIPKETLEKLKDLDVLVLDALHHREHHSHYNLDQAIEQARFIGAEKTYFTHMSHYMGLTDTVEKTLPANMHLAFDGQQFTF